MMNPPFPPLLPPNHPARHQSPEAARDVATDKMSNARRVIGESRMIRTDTLPESVTDEQVAAVLEAVKAYLKERSVSQAQLAKGLCLAASTINQVLKGKYIADARPIIIAMDRWLERRKESDKQPEIARFVETEVARKVRLAAQVAISTADAGLDSRIALVWGDAGCGKTLALEAVAEDQGAIMITCGSDVLSSRSIIGEIAKALHMGVSSRAAETFAAVVGKLRGSGKLIIVDEIHALLDPRDDAPFHMLRRLSDQTGCPQLWAATCDLVELLKLRAQKRDPLSQITSRICCQMHLTAKINEGGGGGRSEPLYTIEQILQIYGANEMKLSRDSGRFLANICRNPKLGLLRECTKLVLNATMMNRARGGMITPQMLWEAVLFTHQLSAANTIRAEVQEDLRDMKLASA